MIITKLLRRLRGFVRFSLRGGCPERVVTLAARDGVSVRDVHAVEGGVCAYVDARDYRRLRRHAKNNGCRMRVERKFGLPFLFCRGRRRNGLIAGAVAAALLLTLLSRSIWVTDVSGNTRVSEGEILSELRRQGIYPGAFKSDIDLIAAEQNALIALPELSWLAVNLRGSRASVEVRERTAPPETVALSAPCNVVAARGGTIKRVSAFKGDAVVSAGDSVAAGDLLVSGLTDEAGAVHAAAECIAVCPVKIEVFIPYSSQEREYTGNTVKKTALRLFNLNIPLSFFTKMSYNEYDTVTYNNRLSFGGAELPVGTEETEYREYVTVVRRLTPEQAAEAASQEARRRAALEKADGETVSETESVTFLPDGAVCTIELTLETDIAKEKEIYIEREADIG